MIVFVCSTWIEKILYCVGSVFFRNTNVSQLFDIYIAPEYPQYSLPVKAAIFIYLGLSKLSQKNGHRSWGLRVIDDNESFCPTLSKSFVRFERTYAGVISTTLLNSFKC